MLQRLQTKSILNEKMLLNNTAASRARQASDNDLISYNLEGLADQFCKIHHVQFAKLKLEERTGTRHGNMIEVTIPFDGDAGSLEYKASTFTHLPANAELHDDCIVVSFPDDDHLDTNVDRFIDLVSQNVEAAQREWSTLNNQAKTDALQILQQRKKILESNQARDAKRSFPIT